MPEILRRREKSSASASITCGEAWCFRGDRFGETRGIIGDGLDVEGEGEALSVLSFGLLELRRRIFVKYVTPISSMRGLTKPFSAGLRQFFQPSPWRLGRVLCPCGRACYALSVCRMASSGIKGAVFLDFAPTAQQQANRGLFRYIWIYFVYYGLTAAVHILQVLPEQRHTVCH
jgi:hypothetical protein